MTNTCSYCGSNNIDYLNNDQLIGICKDCSNSYINESVESTSTIYKVDQIIENTTYKTVKIFIKPQPGDKNECWLVQCIKCNHITTVELPINVNNNKAIKKCNKCKYINSEYINIGDEFGDFRVISYHDKKSKKNHTCWNVECKICGKYRVMQQYELRNNSNIKCKCNKHFVLIGKEFGDFKVISINIKNLDKCRCTYLNLKCKMCDESKTILESELKRNNNIKCNKCHTKILINKEFGDFKIISYYGKKPSKSGKSSRVCWNVECKNCRANRTIPQFILIKSVNLKCSKCNRKKSSHSHSNIIDLTNKEIDNFKILSYFGIVKSQSGKPSAAHWNIQCNTCSHVMTVDGRRLRKNRIIKCENCTKIKNKKMNPRFVDIAGEKFGTLTVISLNGFKNHKSIWNVKCDCGIEKIVLGGSLRSGRATSCGKCIKSKDRILDIKDRIFGKIKVISFSHCGKIHKSVWNTKCKCGNTQKMIGSDLLNGKILSCGKCNQSKSEPSILYINNELIHFFVLKEDGKIKTVFLDIKGDKK